jgi:ribosomal protein L3 glutamine methyltransferase
MLAIMAADVFPNANVTAIDISPDALEVSKINVQNHEMKDRIQVKTARL